MAERHINLGGGPSVARVSVDEGQIRGEGGPLLPQLVVPLTIAMDAQPTGTLAITQLRASLYTTQQVNPLALCCQPIELGLTGGFIAWSMSTGKPGNNSVELRFFLHAAEIEALERVRSANASDTFALYLDLAPTVVGLQNFGESIATTSVTDAPPGPWDSLGFGMYAQTFVFWTAKIETMFLNVERTTWIERVLPGLGYDRLRLVEVTLPPLLPVHGSAASEYDKAKRALDERRYSDCVSACRGLISIWESFLGATSQRRLSEVVAARLGWGESDPRQQFIDGLWKAANDLSNVPHHPEGHDAAPLLVDARDARLLFLTVTSLSEFLGTV